ncbi:response regulator [Rhizobium sp. PAMB 3182]
MAILIVEDNATNALILKHLAKKIEAGEIRVEADPGKALALCHQTLFDLLIVDQMLPTMSGVQFVKAIRMIDRYRQTPVIMVTADHGPDLKAKAIDAGVDDFLMKPVEAVAFRELLFTHLHLPSVGPGMSAAS